MSPWETDDDESRRWLVCCLSQCSAYKGPLAKVCSWQMKAPLRCRTTLWFTIFIFNQREINYHQQIDRTRKTREVFDWHCHSSQHFMPEVIAPDLGMPGILGTLPPFSSTFLRIFLLWQPSFLLCRHAAHPRMSLWPHNGCQNKGKIHCRAEFSHIFHRGHFFVDL